MSVEAERDRSVQRGLVDVVLGVASLVRARGEPAIVEAADRDRRQTGGAGGEGRGRAPAAVGGRRRAARRAFVGCVRSEPVSVGRH